MKQIFLLAFCLIAIFSCMKKPIEEKKRAQVEVDGVQWTSTVNFIEHEGMLDFGITKHSDDLDKTTLYRITLARIKKTTNRQFFGSNTQLRDTAYVSLSRTVGGDQLEAYYTNIIGDTTNNYIQIVHQEDDYTKNMRVIFSADVVGGFANADTIRIRNGVIDFAKEF